MSQEGLPRRRSTFRDGRGLEAWSTLLRFFNLLRKAAAATLEPVDLSDEELVVLICLAHTGGTVSMGEIGRSSLLQAGRLREVVDKLETRRLVACQRPRKDRRKVLTRIERAGRQLLDNVAPTMFGLISRVVEPLGEDGTEFMRAKLRKIVWTAAVDLEGAFGDRRYDDNEAPAPPPALVSEPVVRFRQRPPTWGLAGWLRCWQWSSHVDRIWRREFRGLSLTVPRLQILAALAGAAEEVTDDAIASSTGLSQERLTTTLSSLQQEGLVIRWHDKALRGTSLAKLTTRGEQKVLEALPRANRLADAVYRGLSEKDLEQVLSLVPKLCSAAEQSATANGAGLKRGGD